MFAIAKHSLKAAAAARAPCARTAVPMRSFGHSVKMILRENVQNVGVEGEEVTVKAGFGRNFLYPKKLAVYATEDNIAKYKKDLESQDTQSEEDVVLDQIRKKLSTSMLEFKRHCPTKKTFDGAITTEMISAHMEKKLGLLIGKKRILLKDPIKALGTYKIQLNLSRDLNLEEDSTTEESEEVEATGNENTASEGSAVAEKPEEEVSTLESRKEALAFEDESKKKKKTKTNIDQPKRKDRAILHVNVVKR